MFALLPRSTAALAAATGLFAGGFAAVALAPAAQALPTQPTPDCSAVTSCTVTFAYVGSSQTFTAPDGVTSVVATLRGAQGGNDSRSTGGETTATVELEPGTSLEVTAGQQGSFGGGPTFGGGGAAGDSTYASGGGGSFLSRGSTLLLVAGGGGGSGIWYGGAGGGAEGGTGESVATVPGYYGTPATAGTQSSAGQGGTSGGGGQGDFGAGTNGSGPASATSVGVGGNGGASPQFGNGYAGGGGGGGYYGGGGGSVANGGAGGSGYVAPDPAITDGSTSLGGNSGNGSVSFTWAKSETTTTLSADPSTGGAYPGDTVSLVATVASGVGTPTGTVTFTDGASTISGCGDAVVDATGKATCTTSFDAGSYPLTAEYSGTEGYAGSTGTLQYAVVTPPPSDTFAPDTTITAGPANGSTITVREATFSFQGTPGDTDKLQCSLDGVAYTDCTSPVTFTDLADGAHTVAFRAIDAAGNIDATPATRSFTVTPPPAEDTTAPDTTITAGPAQGSTITTNTATFSFEGTAGDTDRLQCSLDGAVWEDCTSPVTFTDLTDGAHTLAFRAIDAAGNIDATPATRSFTVSTAPPEPDNTFRVATKSKANTAKGTRTVRVVIPGPGTLRVAPIGRTPKKTATTTRTLNRGGAATITIKPTKAGKRLLAQKLRRAHANGRAVARLRVRVGVTFTPDGGTPNTIKRVYILKRR